MNEKTGAASALDRVTVKNVSEYGGKAMGENIKESMINVIQSHEFKNSLMQTMEEALREQHDKFCEVSFIERQKIIKSNAFRNTERLLYSLDALEKHLESESEYLAMAFHESSGSVVKYQKNKPEKPTDDQLLQDRQKSYKRSLQDLKKIKKAIAAVSDHKGFSIIRQKYLTPGHPKITYEQLAEELAGQDGFSEHLNEKTVRRYHNLLINEIATILFGSDAI